MPDTVPPKSENKPGCPPHPTRVSNLPPDQPSHKVAPESKPLEPAIKEIVVRASNLEESKIVPIEIRGKLASTVTDTGAQVTIVSSQFFDSLNCSLPSEPVILKGIDREKSVEGYVVKKVPLTLGGRSYKWGDLYVALIEDELLLGLDFMVYHKVDPLIVMSC